MRNIFIKIASALSAFAWLVGCVGETPYAEVGATSSVQYVQSTEWDIRSELTVTITCFDGVKHAIWLHENEVVGVTTFGEHNTSLVHC